MYKILIIDDDVDTCKLLTRFLEKNNYEVDSAYSGASGLVRIQNLKYDVILCDFRLGDYDGRDIIAKARQLSPGTQIIMITGYSEIKIAVEVMKMGAHNYITKPLLPEEILLSISNALKADHTGHNVQVNSSAKNGAVKKELKTEYLEKFIEGSSDEAKKLYKQIDLVAATPYSVIIYGESGTGKESVANRIHLSSERSNQPFIAVDCGSLSKELAGSELFGHEKGSFTGALNAKTGCFELADTGTIFLDEVGNLSYDIQAMLLRVLQERTIRKVGGNKDIPIDVRVIVASNENLYQAVKKGRFREDLYHRFNEFTINVPALRERNVDIMEFARFFLAKACLELNKSITRFSPEVENIFLMYEWPGNLRELNNVIKRAVLLSNSDSIEISTLPHEVVYFDKFSMPAADSNEPRMIPVGEISNLKFAAADAELKLIHETLKKVKYNKSKAARLLNIDRKTLYNKMKVFNIPENEHGY